MKPFNNEIEVGQKALIIGCKHPENSWVIGMTVTVEGLFLKYESVPDEFRSELGRRTPHDRRGKFIDDSAVVSGFNINDFLRENHAVIARKYLMPIPPLGDMYDEELFDEMVNLKIKNH